jgi:hypothetical protein
MKYRSLIKSNGNMPSTPITGGTIFISYNWLLMVDVLNATKQLIENFEITSVGSTYEEAKDIAAHLLKKKGIKIVQIKNAASTGIRFAYYQDDKTNIPQSDYPDLPVAIVPAQL